MNNKAQISEKSEHLHVLIKSIAGYDRYIVKEFLATIADDAAKAADNKFIGHTIVNALVRRSSGNFAERNFQEIKNILTRLAKDKPQVIDNLKVAVKQQKKSTGSYEAGVDYVNIDYEYVLFSITAKEKETSPRFSRCNQAMKYLL